MTPTPSSIYIWHLVFVVAVILLLLYLDRMSTSPILAIANRWVRWFSCSFGISYLAFIFEWSARPFWVLVLSAFLSWFLLETIYNWIAISALSRSPVPLFPKFEINRSGDEWPAQRRFIGLREWLRREGFERLAAIRAEIIDTVVLRLSVYQNSDGTIRMQVMFLPHRSGRMSVCFIIFSQARDGSRLVTDNYFLPYGGFYPENWSVERKPLIISPERLLDRHRARMARFGLPFDALDDDPLTELNDQQRILERINVDLGFLFPRHLHEEHGKITQQGRYRFWKELWLLNYFGCPIVK
jgi:hypothetical protein